MKKKVIISILILFMFILPLTFSQRDGWNEGEAKSKTDPIYIDFPEPVHQSMPAKAVIYINDKNIQQNAKYMEVSTGTSNPYMFGGNKVYFDSSGVFRETIPYNGEDKIEFGFRPSEYADGLSSVSVTFYSIKKSPGMEWPNTEKEDSPYYKMGCIIESNDLLCGENSKCMICNKVWGSALREYSIGWTKQSVNPPSRFSFVNGKDDDDEWTAGRQPFYADYLYSKEKKITTTQGMETGQIETYALKLELLSDRRSLAEQRDDLERFHKGTQINDISAPGGLAEGPSLEIISYTPPKKGNTGIEWFSIDYRLYSEMVPRGSGIIKVTATRQTVLPEGSSDSEKDAIIREAKAFASSYMLTKGKEGKVERELTHWYSVIGSPKQEETTDEYIVAGHISDYFDHPLPYMQIVATIDGKEYRGNTDEDGVYKIPLVGLDLKEGEEKDVVLFAMFDYYRNGKNYFDIYYKKPNNHYDSFAAYKKGKLVYGEHLQIDFQMDGDGEFGASIANKQDIKHYSLIYFHTAEAVEFVLDILKEDMDYKLPVTIYVGNQNKKTLYSPDDSRILISAAQTSLSDSNRPDNREYHEFMHALMYDIYNAWPAGRTEPGNKNHDGFLNPNTGDSYLEGFAEFMALVVSDEMGEDSPSIYAGFGSMENNYKPWDGRGLDEEFAVASLLWDIYDDRNEKGDSITLPIEEIWKVLKTNRRDFYEYYKAFKQEFSEQANAFDELFKLHGFFYDTRVGDGNYNPGEPWKFTNQQETDYMFIDMSGNVSKIKFQEGFIIGKATNYNRTIRSSTVRIPDAYLKIKDNEVDFYTIKVLHKDSSFDYEYVVERAEEKIYIQPLPFDESVDIIVTPLSSDYKAEDIFTINSQEMNEFLQPNSKLDGYFAEHEFNLKSTGSSVDEKYILFSDTKPSNEYEGDLGEEYEIKVDDSKEFNTGENVFSKSKFSFGKIVLLLLIAIFAYFYVKKPEFKKKSNSFFKKVILEVKKAIKWFIKSGIPFIIKILKGIWSKIIKISKTIFHHTKNVYNETKPHLKKAHESIKKKLNNTKKKR